MRNLSWMVILGLAVFGFGCDDEDPGGGGDGGGGSLHNTPTPQTEEEKKTVLAEKLMADLNVAEVVPTMTDEIVGNVAKELPDITPAQTAEFRKHVQIALEADFKNLMVKTMTDYWTLEELQALSEDRMIPSIEKKMGGWEKFAEERGFEWGVTVGEEAMEKALGGK